MEYLTADQIRTAFGDDVEGMSDSDILERLDEITDGLESYLGHGFGRAVRIWSEVGETVSVLSDRVTVGATDILFEDAPTLRDLVTDMRLAGLLCEILPCVPPNQPSRYLSTCSFALEAGYEGRQTLSLGYLTVWLTGDCRDRVFLPFDIDTLELVTEDGLSVLLTDLAVQRNWIIRQNESCPRVSRTWSNHHVNNIVVVFVPSVWGTIPRTISGYVRSLFSESIGVSTFQSERFLDYSYTRGSTPSSADPDRLSATVLRRYRRKLVIKT